jgi:hypothetical protein
MAAAVLTMRSPLFDGPVATALGGADLNWIVGFPVSALAYAVLTRFRGRATDPPAGESARFHGAR